MKIIICHLLILVVVALCFNQQAEVAAAAAPIPINPQNSAVECMKEGNLNDEDTKRIKAGELFSPKYKEASEKLQCFLLCCYKKVGIIGADGQKQPELVVKYLENRFADKKDKIKSTLSKCNNIKSSNPCEVVYQFEACVVKNLM